MHFPSFQWVSNLNSVSVPQPQCFALPGRNWNLWGNPLSNLLGQWPHTGVTSPRHPPIQQHWDYLSPEILSPLSVWASKLTSGMRSIHRLIQSGTMQALYPPILKFNLLQATKGRIFPGKYPSKIIRKPRVVQSQLGVTLAMFCTFCALLTFLSWQPVVSLREILQVHVCVWHIFMYCMASEEASFHGVHRTDSMLAPSQWETLLQSDAVSLWWDTNLEPAPAQEARFFFRSVPLYVLNWPHPLGG